jgi:hypothetical protein
MSPLWGREETTLLSEVYVVSHENIWNLRKTINMCLNLL